VVVAAHRAVLSIGGMRNNSCRESLADALMKVEGVKDVIVSLFRARAIVSYGPPCDLGALVEAVKGAGFVAMPAEEGAG